MGITLGRGEVLVTCQSLHNGRRGTAAKELSHKRVSQVVKPETEKPMRLHALWNACRSAFSPHARPSPGPVTYSCFGLREKFARSAWSFG